MSESVVKTSLPSSSRSSSISHSSRSCSLSSASCSKKAKMDAEGDRVLVESLREIQEPSQQRRALKEDIDANFGMEVAGRLKSLHPKQNALAKLKIQQILFDMEFGEQDSA